MSSKFIAVVIAVMLMAGCQSVETPIGSAEGGSENIVESSETDVSVSESSAVEDLTTTTKKFLMIKNTNGVEKAALDHYDIQAKLDPDNKSLACKQTTTYINKENIELNEVVFQILPNAYKSLDTAPVLFGDVDSIYPNGFSPGYIEFSEILLNCYKGDLFS